MLVAPMGLPPLLWGLFLMGIFGFLLYVGIMKTNTPELAFSFQIFICIIALLFLGIETITTPHAPSGTSLMGAGGGGRW